METEFIMVLIGTISGVDRKPEIVIETEPRVGFDFVSGI
jgi:hypothetical protein